MTKTSKRVVVLFVVFIIGMTCFGSYSSNTAYAASKYITRKQAIKLIVQELDVPVDSQSDSSYLAAATSIGLINSKTFKNYNRFASKADLAILLVRADEYLYGVTLSNSLIDEVIECRISDISDISAAIQPYLAKAYALGYIKGRTNGSYSTNRKLCPKYKVTIAYAKQLIGMIKNKEARHQISPDGQLIRTTKLPEFAEFYPYILASYPNEYYDWEFSFMKLQSNGEPLYGTKNLQNLVDYAAPCDFVRFNYGKPAFYTFMNSREKKTASEVYELCKVKWEENVRSYLECVFNVNYTTLKDNDKWINQLVACDYNGLCNPEGVKELINSYIDKAIENETIVESKVIAVDKSTIYWGVWGYSIRAYVKYRVISSKDLSRVAFSPIIFSRDSYINLLDLQLNDWRDCYVDITVSSSYENCGVKRGVFNDYYHDVRVVMIDEK